MKPSHVKAFAAVLAALAVGLAVAADEFAVAFRVRLDEPVKFVGKQGDTGLPVAYGLLIRASGMYGSSPFVFRAQSTAGVLGARTYETYVEAETNPGVWHHVAFTFSHEKREARAYFDGVSQQAWTLADEEKFDDAALLKLTPAKSLAGEIADFKVFKDRVPELAELFAGDVPDGQVTAAKAAFERAAAEPGVTPAFSAWCRAKAGEAAKFGKGTDFAAWHRLETLRHRLVRLVPLAKTKVDGAFLPFTIDRYWANKHLPYAVPADAKPFAGACIAGAKGEWDCDSFMVHPLEDAKDFYLKPTDLKGPNGEVVKASEIDVRVVKCWYQCGNAFKTYFPAGRSIRLLCPEMLLHDDKLMRVDTASRVNWLRISYADGDQYADVSLIEPEENMTPFNINQEPVADAKEFRPLDLHEGEMRQFWLTAKLPDDRAPGDYTGALEMSVGGKPCGTIPLTVRVYPFRLPWPAPHYDIDRPMLHSYLSHTSMREFLSGSRNVGETGYPSWSASIRRRDNMIRNMVEHGFGNIDGVASFGGETNEWDFSDADAVLQKRNGAQLKPILGDIGVEWSFALWNRYPPKGKTDLSVEANYDFWSQTMQSYSNKLARAQAKLMEAYGHTQVVCYGFDEAGPETVRREMPYFATLNHYGSLSYTSQGRPEVASFMTDWDGCPQSIHRSTAHSWHASGALLTTYAVPHGGPECPDLWRRRKGLFLWFADFDGQREYIWFEGRNVWNDFITGTQYKCFNMVQPTFDGVIDSVQWEANREGIDDMRYATLLKRACRAARETGDAALVKAGRENDAWLELSDYRAGDLDELRRQMAARIDALLKALEAKGVDVAKFSPPLPARQDLPLPEPSKLTGDGYARRGILDYACRAWEQEGTEDALFKSVNGHLRLREVEAAEKLLTAIEARPDLTPSAKARAKLRRGFLGLTRTKHVWTPKMSDLEKATKALDTSVRHDLPRVGVGELGHAADKLMRAWAAVGEQTKSIAVGEMLAEGPLKKAIGGRGSPISANEVYIFVGDQYFALKQYKRAMEWFSKCGKMFDGLVRKGDAAKALGDYPSAMAAYSDAANLLDDEEGKHKKEQIRRMIGEISKAVRKHTKQNVSDDLMRNSEADDEVGGISLDE